VNLIVCCLAVTEVSAIAMESCLIPYRFSKNEAFQAWIGVRLAEFPPDREQEILDNFHHQSVVREAKEPLLMQLKEPWSYTMTGLLDGDYVLHKLPMPLSNQNTRCPRLIPKFLKRS